MGGDVQPALFLASTSLLGLSYRLSVTRELVLGDLQFVLVDGGSIRG